MVTVFAHGQSVSYVPYDSTDVAWVGAVELFAASDTLHGVELWRSDGTAAGTVQVSNLGGSTPLQISVINGRLHILTNNTSPGYQNWISDGTTAGTVPASSRQLVSAIVSWSPVTLTTTGTPLTNLGGYKIYFGPSLDALTSVIEFPDPSAVSYVVPDLMPGRMWFAVTAYINGGAESNLSAYSGKVLQ